MAYIFQTLTNRASRSNINQSNMADAREWFRDEAVSMKNVNVNRMMKTAGEDSSFGADSVGKMYMFFYDPKWKDVLPYYDKFPLVFPIEIKTDGFLGINVHYIPPVARAGLMDSLYSLEDKYNDNKKLILSYDILKSASRFKAFQPCLKRYLFSHVVSGFKNVDYDDWDKALMLPSERFVKGRRDRVFKESMGKI